MVAESPAVSAAATSEGTASGSALCTGPAQPAAAREKQRAERRSVFTSDLDLHHAGAGEGGRGRGQAAGDALAQPADRLGFVRPGGRAARQLGAVCLHALDALADV